MIQNLYDKTFRYRMKLNFFATFLTNFAIILLLFVLQKLFILHSFSSFQGLISVSGNLDREKISVYYLLITASDNGIPPRLGQAYVSLLSL